ncbi:MAG: helix-turn-helix domain-containing protein [Verrucomicrobiaceae bacterium]|nr:MAG: helix-turn-helix domain-containing protein [Verrucomicrobiaceae bacterium]
MRHTKNPAPVRVALLLGRQLGYCRDVMTGIQRFALAHPDWIFHEGPPDSRVMPLLREWRPHGIIGHVYARDLLDTLNGLKIPLVLACSLPGAITPNVDVDHLSVGRMAAEYFLRKGFRHFGYFGSGRARFSLEREEGFRETLRGHGFDLSVCHMEYLPTPPFNLDTRRLDKIVEGLLRKCSRPLAVFASNDIAARQLAEECRRMGLSIPSEVAILGVDNDEYECMLSTPPLSSIAIPSEQIGFSAAEMLDCLMRGKTPRNQHPALPPLYVVSRHSTDYFVVSDPVVNRALKFIRERTTQPLTVDEVRKHCAVSRRILERRFQSALQQTALQVIHRACVERAKPLLERTRLDLNSVAGQCGFSSARQMTDVFRKSTGQSPAHYRKHIAG